MEKKTWRSIWGFGLMVGVLALLVASGSGADKSEYIQLFQRGEKFYAAGDYEGAIKELRQAVTLKPGLAKAHFLLGIIYARTGRNDLAREALTQVVKLEPQNALAHNHLGTVYRALGRFDLATQELQQAVRIDPNYEEALLNLARLYLDLAARQYEELLRLKPDNPELMQAYRKLLASDPNNPRARYYLARLLLKEGKEAEAIAEMEKVVGQEGVDQAEVHHSLGNSYHHLGQPDRAIVHLHKALELKETPQSHWVLGQAYEKRGDYGAAEREYQVAARLQPNDEEVKARLKELRSKRPALAAQLAPLDTLPDFLIGTEGGRGGHLLVVEKRSQRLLLYRCKEDTCQTAKTYRCSTGQKDGDKLQAGDRRTPEGVYFFTGILQDHTLLPRYGVRAFTMNYPNFIDRSQGKNGNGIWLHGTDKPRLPQTDTRGCVVLNNQDVLDLSRYIRLRETPIVIVDRVNLLPQGATQVERQKVKQLLSGWKEAWERKQLDDYIAYYADEFSSMGMDRQGWRQYKEKINQKVQQIQVTFSDLRILRQKGFLVVVFQQLYRSDQHSDRGIKRLYLRTNKEGQWKIWGEEWSALQGDGA
ncbi:MAG: tetratricopeptide repeat protein [Candidatus Tectomicrobia bacterium]|uniref:Tetratricopeptide repeat protein n=1 Tax=Tectimicrobiota bacterium TaxID=2528274 RepID=A0A932FXU0_UNCTE|nr:tetratricopeptide repeat protein [Candidatus Tectomicrobia bacterium]